MPKPSVCEIRTHFDRHGFGLWAVQPLDGPEFIGFAGLSIPHYEAPFMPAVEIGWRLAFEFWGNGYASEAAKAVLSHAWDVLQLDEIKSITIPTNLRSRAVMERIGMTRDLNGDFEHPLLPPEHPLRLHVRYRKQRESKL